MECQRDVELLERRPDGLGAGSWSGRVAGLSGFGRVNAARRPSPTARFASSTAAAGSCSGSAAAPTSRVGAVAQNSAIQSL